MRGLLRVGLLLALVANLSACTGVGGSTPAGTVVLGVQSQPDTLNPILGYAPDGASKLFDGLVARDAQLRLVPALAEALPEVSNDGRTYTFRLRQGVRFHDGQPLLADDVVFTYQAILDPATDTTLRRDLDMITAVTAPDERTVVFRLAYPYAPFVQRTTVGIVPRHAFTGQGAGGSPPAGQDINTAQFNAAPIGTGPFVFEEWKPGDRLVLRANPDYWGGRPVIARLVLAFVPDDHVRATRMERGDFDATHLLPKAAARFRNREGVTVYDVPAADYRGVMFPLNHPVTGDVTIRRALSQAIDRNALVKGVLDGTGKPAYGPISPDMSWFNPVVILTNPADRDAANTMLYEAGWIMGADGVRVRGNQPARFTLMYPANDTLRKDLALAVASTGAQIGIDIQVEGLDWDAIEPRMANDALIMGWGTPYDPDFTNYQLFHSQFAGQGFFNPGHLRDAEIDRLLNDARRTADTGMRKAAYHAVQARLAGQAVWAWLVYLEHVYVVRDRFDGIEVQIDPHARGMTHGIWWNIERWQPRG
jgi:peptide/nickel transport system substrate-binding protein